MSNALEARARLEAYIARRKVARGLDINDIHGFDVGPDCGFVLRLSDIEAVLALSAPPEQWQPIALAPEGRLVVVGWIDPEDGEERHDFDYLEDGGWSVHENNREHFEMCAPPGSVGPKDQPPYTHFLALGPLPAPPARDGEPA